MVYTGVKKMLEGEGRVYRTGRSVVVRLPKNLVLDSCFPFKLGELVHVQIQNGKIIVSKKRKLEEEVKK